MTIIEKLERALALAKELNFNDQQVQELVSLILGLPITRITFQQPPLNVPYNPNTTPYPYSPLNDHTIICSTPFQGPSIGLQVDCSGITRLTPINMAVMDACGLNNFGSC